MSAADRPPGSADALDRTLRDTFEDILDQVRRAFDPTGCAFLIVDAERRRIEPAAAWFSSPAVGSAMGNILRRRYDPERPGLTEAAMAAGGPLVVREIERWTGAQALRERLVERLGPDEAGVAWEWYCRSRFVSCPVGTSPGRVHGVLALALGPERAISDDDLRAVHGLAELAAIVLERSELLQREAARVREEQLLRDAAHEMSASLELEDVDAAIVEHARRLSGSRRVELWRADPAFDGARLIAAAGAPRGPGSPVDPSPAQVDAASSGRARWDGDVLHVPLVLGPRPFGVLSVQPDDGGADRTGLSRRLEALAPLAAGAIANALAYRQERRVARALSRGFVPVEQPQPDEVETGLVYEPAEVRGGSGDVFGVWPLGDGGVAVLVGDVTGKGLEVSATSAMVRFFVEACAWDSASPSAVVGEVNALLAFRGEVSFTTVFLGMLRGGRLTYVNAGHVPPLLRRADGGLVELTATGIPLGVEAGTAWEERVVDWRSGDLLFAATDGLVEARREGVILGERRVRDLVAEEGGRLGPGELVSRLRDVATEWGGRLRDDMVLLAVRRR